MSRRASGRRGELGRRAVAAHDVAPLFRRRGEEPPYETVGRGHGGEKLSPEESAKLACWIDLAVPYCGDYLEANAWSAAEKALYERFQQKRRSMEQIERSNIEAWVAAGAKSLPPATASP